VRFSTDPGIDTVALAAAIGPGATVAEEGPGAYRLRLPADARTPAVVAALAGWLAGRNLSLGDLRTGQSLEEAYLAITGTRDAGGDAGVSEPVRGRRGRGRRSR